MTTSEVMFLQQVNSAGEGSSFLLRGSSIDHLQDQRSIKSLPASPKSARWIFTTEENSAPWHDVCVVVVRHDSSHFRRGAKTRDGNAGEARRTV